METHVMCFVLTLVVSLAGVHGALECPDIPEGTKGICVDSCTPGAMEGCTDGKLCCSNGCGHVCMPPKQFPLYCPAAPEEVEGICSEDCQKGDCEGHQMCCSNGCGHACTTGVHLTCPAPKGGAGGCTEDCPVDGCPGGQLCCSNGCGHQCMDGEIGVRITSEAEPEAENTGSISSLHIFTSVLCLALAFRM